jgi:hypothetical protein
MEAKSNASP